MAADVPLREEIAAVLRSKVGVELVTHYDANHLADALLPVVQARIAALTAERDELIQAHASALRDREAVETEMDERWAERNARILVVCDERDQARAALGRVEALLTEDTEGTGIGVSCAGYKVTDDGCYAGTLAAKIRAALASEGSPPAAHEFWPNAYDATCSGGIGPRCGKLRDHPIHTHMDLDVEHLRLPDGRCVISVAGQGHLPCSIHPAPDAPSDETGDQR